VSDLNDLIARSSVLSYQQGRKDERLAILRLAKECSMNRDNGDYVYLDDLNDYIDEYDREQNAKIYPQED
jgi:hypothetical protein